MTNTPTYYSWANMLARCTNTNHPAYPRYGGRGITVCDRWKGKEGFKNFLTDMGEKPNGLTLERIDNSGGYTSTNCRWATRKEQAANTRHINLLDIDIEWVRAHPEKSRNELAQALGVSEVTISNIRNRKGRFADPS
jgi:DNA-binding XRE family transcriptional regulator